MNKILTTLVLAAVALAALISLLWLGVFSHGDSAQASPTLVVGFDMNPYGSPANTCPNDGVTDCTIGSVQRCKLVPNTAGTTFDVDVFVTGLTNGFTAWNANVTFPDPNTAAKLTLTSHVAETDTSVNLITQSAGSSNMSASEAVPDPPGSTEAGSPHHCGVTEGGTSEGVAFTQGVLGRYQFTVGAGATSGYYGLTLPSVALSLTDKDAGTYTVDEIWDYNHDPQYGIIALGVRCPGIPVGGLAVLPEVSGSSTPNYIVLAGLAAAAVLAITAGGWHARRRWLR
jgi:hypothetical protein